MDRFKVDQIMTRLVVVLSRDETVHDAAAKLAANGISGAPVVEDGQVIGMVSESDILHAVPPATKRRRSILEYLVNSRNLKPMHPSWGPLVGDIMSSIVIFQVEPGTSIWEAAHLMDSRGVKRLPVIDHDGKLVGIVSRADIIRALGRPDETIRDDVIATLGVLGPEVFRDLEVEVHQGVAELRGDADRKSTKHIAVRLARRVPGVLEVRDELTFMADDSTLKVEFSERDVENLSPFSSISRKA